MNTQTKIGILARRTANGLKGTTALAAWVTIAMLLCIGAVSSATAQTIRLHANNNDPTTENFAAVNGTLPAFATNDGGTLAWAILDTNPSAQMQYVGAGLGFPELGLMKTNWQVVWKLKVVDEQPFGSRGVEMNFRQENEAGTSMRYNLQFTRSGSDMIVDLTGGATITSLGGGTGFHTWQLTKRPGSDLAAFSVDGTFLTNYSGFADTSGNRFYWGSVVNSSQGHSEWAMVLLEIPEPSALVLLMGAGLILLPFRRRA